MPLSTDSFILWTASRALLDDVNVRCCVSTLVYTTRNAWTSWSIYVTISWLRGTVVERRSLTGKLSLSCARPAPDG